MKRKFLSTLWLQALTASLVVLGAVIVVAYILRPVANNTGSQQRQRSTNPQQAVANGQEYLITVFDQIDPGQRLLLDYLYRKFAIKSQFNAQSKPINIDSVKDDGSRLELAAIKRFAYPESLVKDLGPSPSLVARAANCDNIPLPANISNLIQQEIDKGEYELTHAALAMQLMTELGCQVNNVATLESQILSVMTSMAADTNTHPDLRYECIAFLMYMNKRDQVKSEWIDQIVADQQLNGGWSIDQGNTSNEHTTVLALWALLEYTHPNSSKEPIIRRE